MQTEQIAQIRATATLLYGHARRLTARVPMKARVVLGLFLAAAFIMAIYTTLTAKNSSLHLKVQHGFHDAQIWVWVDGDLAYSGSVTGSNKKRFGFFPTDTVQGSLSQIIPVRSGHHIIRVRVAPDEGSTQDDSISGDFARNNELDLSASARRNGLSLAWQGTGNADSETSSFLALLSRYAVSLMLTIAGSIISALTGFAIKELPGRLRAATDTTSKVELGPR